MSSQFNLTLYIMCLHTALAVHTRSPAAYDALRSFKLLQLPCIRTLKYYIDSNLEEAGEVEKRLLERKGQYDKLVQLHQEQLEAKKAKKPEEEEEEDAHSSKDVLPIGEGALIINEVKVLRCTCTLKDV